MRRWSKIVVISVMVVFLVPPGIWFYENIWQPSWYSSAVACGIITVEELESDGWYISGSYDPNDDTITIYEEDPVLAVSTSKHERIHQVQAKEGRLVNYCIFFHGIMANEIEANLGEYLPEKVFDDLY